MSKLNRNVPAFSLIEMLIVMVLSSMAVGIVYFVLFNVGQFQTDLARKYQRVGDLNGLKSWLTYDIDRSDSVVLQDNNAIVCHLRNSNIRIRYTLDGATIYREQQERKDSILCQDVQLAAFFQQRPIASGLIDKLVLRVGLWGDGVRLTFYKLYDAAALTTKHREKHE